MPDVYKTFSITQSVPGGPSKEQLVGVVVTSSGVADSGKIVSLNALGIIDPTLISPTGSIAFNGILSGINTTANLVVGSGATLGPTGSGVINATEINGIPIIGILTPAGQIPISQPGNATAVWADPLVQGIQAAGTSATTVNPVLVAGVDAAGAMLNISVNGDGDLIVSQPAAAGLNATVVFPSAQHVIVDSGGGGGTQYTAGASVTTPTGTVAMGQNASNVLEPLFLDTNKNLFVIEYKDTGRVYCVWFIDSIATTTSETLINVGANRAGTVSSPATTYTVTTGKTLRIQSFCASIQEPSSVVEYVKLRIRSASTVNASSPVVLGLLLSTSGVTNNAGYGEISIPDGLEIAGGQEIGISQLSDTTTANVTFTLIGYEY